MHVRMYTHTDRFLWLYGLVNQFKSILLVLKLWKQVEIEPEDHLTTYIPAVHSYTALSICTSHPNCTELVIAYIDIIMIAVRTGIANVLNFVFFLESLVKLFPHCSYVDL